jgi:sugar lactone lactonase YvrE
MGLDFVCGLNGPEDLEQIPGTRWIIASGMGHDGGVSLIDSDARTAHRFFTGTAHAAPKMYPDCPGPPTHFNTHGISLKPTGTQGIYTLYTVTHAPFESIQVFAVDARRAAPSVAWTGCVKLPADFNTNAVTATNDGKILANVTRRGNATTDWAHPALEGGVWEWSPADKSLHFLEGTQQGVNNGIEISQDEREIYINASGTQTVAIYSLADTSKPVRTVRTPWFNLDNIHWSGDRLIAAGMMYDEPSCGGTRAQIQAAHLNPITCHRGWVAAQLDPNALTWHILGYGEPNPMFGGIATALVIGKTLWLSSYSMDRVAYRPLGPPDWPANPLMPTPQADAGQDYHAPVPIEKPTTCAPSMGLSFVCGLNGPEDMLPIPGTKWIVASSMGVDGGVFLIDSESKALRVFFTGASKPDAASYPDCSGPPTRFAHFNAHGIALRPAPGGTYTLYTVTHLPFESIQVFAVDARAADPGAVWIGCVKLPEGLKGNAVTATQDGTILVTVGQKGVWQWHRADKSTQLLSGVYQPNGIELSRDETQFYTATSGNQTISVYSRNDPAKPIRAARTPFFNVDNIHWSDDRLITSGTMFDEPACGGTRAQVQAAGGNPLTCHRGWAAGQLDPSAMSWTILGYGEANPMYFGTATALVLGRTLWLSSYTMDRVAYRPLPGAQ